MYIKAYAKINVYLDVLKRNEDGYHDLDMVMLPLELHDSIDFEHVPFLSDCYVTCDHVELQETKYNSINLTLKEMKERYQIDKNFSVLVHKEIPISAGLGGGSSNAAATIRAINEICKLDLPLEEQLSIGKKIGADVPFCVINKPAHVRGIGEKIELVELKKRYHVLIVKPHLGLSTKFVFEESDKTEYDHGNVDNVITALKTGNDKLLAESMFNGLEKTSITLVPEIQQVKDRLFEEGFKMVLMSGSGSCVFALTDDGKFASQKFKKLEKEGLQVYLTRTLKIK